MIRRDPPTSMGGSQVRFPSTTITRLPGLGTQKTVAGRQVLALFFGKYWKPIYAYIRRKTGSTNEDAKDLTQGFLAKLIEKDLLARYDPSQGRLRSYLKGILENFLYHELRDRGRRKRGGNRRALSLEGNLGSERQKALAARELSPEEAFDKAWALTVLAAAQGKLERRFLDAGQKAHWECFRRYYLQGAPATYEEVARSQRTTEDTVRNHLAKARRMLREILFEVLAEYEQTGEEVSREFTELSKLF